MLIEYILTPVQNTTFDSDLPRSDGGRPRDGRVENRRSDRHKAFALHCYAYLNSGRREHLRTYLTPDRLMSE